MKLNILPTETAADTWYADGLKFTCSQCGNCCTGGPGYVWIERDEIGKLAAHLKLTPEQVVEQYCRKVDGKFSLKERRSPAGLYDCIFLKEMKVPARGGGEIVHTIRACSVYPVRPLQCRTWPFWPENLSSQQAWDRAAKRCHGMNAPAGRTFSTDEIHAIRDAAAWPKRPPTSAPKSPSSKKGVGEMRAVTCESLEGRRLLASSFEPFALKVNFQRLIDTTVPPGYRADIGAPYGRRSNGLTYGWSSDVSANALNRNDPRSPDERYDTFNYLGETDTWQVAVPDPGAYGVRVVAGDPKVFNSRLRIAAEHVIVVAGDTTTTRRWFEGMVVVAVSDGALTLTSVPGAVFNKLCFVEIVRVEPPAAPPPAPGAVNARTVSTVTNVVTWADTSADETGFKIERKRGTGGAYEPIAVVRAGVTRFVDTQLRPATTYTYRVRAFNAAGGSPASNQDPARTFATSGTLVWEPIAPAPVPRAEALTATIAGKLYVFGGFSGTAGPVVRSDVYDPLTNAWSPLPDLPARLTHAGVAALGRDIYFAGGYVGIGPGFEQEFGTSQVWRFNVDTRQYTRMADLPAALASGGLVALGRKLHYFGGNDAARQDVDVHYVLDLDNPTTWTTAAALPAGRSHLGYVALGGKIYAIGGQFDNDQELTTSPLVHAWDPAAPGAWTALAPLPQAISHISSSTFTAGNRIIVAGGETGHEDPAATVFTYDPLANAWESLAPLPGPRFSGAARAIEGVLYFTGGSSQTTTYRGVFAG